MSDFDTPTIDELGADITRQEVDRTLRHPENIEDEPRREGPLDNELAQRLLARFREWRREEMTRQKSNRYQTAVDMDYVDHIQWRDEEAAVLDERGQAPLVFNRIWLAVRWLIGSMVRTRLDWKILPRGKDDDDLAQVKTKVFKYVSDTSRAPAAMSAAMKDAIKGGAGWVEVGVNTDPSKPLIFCRRLSWRNMWFDSRQTDADYDEDGRYIIVEKFVDSDIARAAWPTRKGVINRSIYRNVSRDDDELAISAEVVTDSDDVRVGRWVPSTPWTSVENMRQRVRVTECWYKVPRQCKVLKGGALHGIVFNPQNSVHSMALASGDSRVVQAFKLVVRKAVWCEGGMLEEGPSPYRHNKFPIVPVWGYRRDRDNMPYGQVRGMRDAQDDYNQRRSRALFQLSTNQVHYETGAFANPDKALAEIRRPDGEVEYKLGKLGAVNIVTGLEKVQGDLELMREAAQHIEAQGGYRGETMNVTPHDLSGKALRTLEDLGQTITSEFTENYMFAFRKVGELMLSCIEQFMTEEDTIRITDEKHEPEFVEINTPVWSDKLGRWEYLNDITKTQADFIVTASEFRNSVRESMYESFLDLISKLPPEMGIKLLDIAIDIHPDVPNKTEVLKRVRELAGIDDPRRQLSPEEIASKQRAAALQARVEEAGISKMEAEVDKLVAEVGRMRTESGKIDAVRVRELVTAVYTALQAGQIVATVPEVTPAADQVLQGAGFVDAGGAGLDTSDPPPMPIPVPQPPIQDARQTDGAQQGIETPRNDGVI